MYIGNVTYLKFKTIQLFYSHMPLDIRHDSFSNLYTHIQPRNTVIKILQIVLISSCYYDKYSQYRYTEYTIIIN